ncbi:uncharacterized protein N7506_001468 [Penicillium brevicompactum]|uniref:uncharacterized protein n=1 Tax=Penicillium brevicompactum TaxID=5074 RepID=UPI002541E746|nr:uncharacterized protein N7506_001468 [Penicillium brevicompactum]KAJ5348215.1 hypothetical protein N7506_001468 [Penicillium brevicompactum]
MPKASSKERPRACSNSSRAKAKCVQVDNDADTCQRFCVDKAARQSDVSLSPAINDMKTKSHDSSYARVLERKLDDIVTLLTREREQASMTRSPQTLEPPTFIDESLAGTPTQSGQNQGPVPLSTQLTRTVPSEDSISIVPAFDVSFLEADQVLQEYMTTMLPEFPFVPLPFKSSSDMLKEQPTPQDYYMGLQTPAA